MSLATDTVTDDAVIVMSRVYEAPRDLVWAAITQPRHVARWWGGPGFSNPVCEMDVRKGGAWTHVMRFPDGHELHMDFVFVEVDPPRRLVQSFRALWGEDVKSEGTSRITWEISPVGDSCLLKVTHDQLRQDANDQLYGGWPMILSGLKTWLETGTVLTTPGSLMYG